MEMFAPALPHGREEEGKEVEGEEDVKDKRIQCIMGGGTVTISALWDN